MQKKADLHVQTYLTQNTHTHTHTHTYNSYGIIHGAQCSPQAMGEAYRKGVVSVEPTTTTKILALPHSHIKEKSVLRAYWANITQGQHWCH